MTTQQWIKTVARWTGVVLSILSVAFAFVSYTTHWDWWLGPRRQATTRDHDPAIAGAGASLSRNYQQGVSLSAGVTRARLAKQA